MAPLSSRCSDISSVYVFFKQVFVTSILSLCIINCQKVNTSISLSPLSSRCSDISSVCGPPIFPHWITAFATPLIAKFFLTPFFYTNPWIAKFFTPFVIQIPGLQSFLLLLLLYESLDCKDFCYSLFLYKYLDCKDFLLLPFLYKYLDCKDFLTRF